VRGGRALLHPAFPAVWDFNFVRVERPDEIESAAALVAEASRVIAEAGCDHCQLRFEDAATVARLSAGLERAGLTHARHAFLVRTASMDRTADATHVREVDEATLRPVRERAVRGELPDRSDDVVRQLVDLHDVIDRATTMRRYAAFAGDEVAAYCSVYTEGDVAQIEEVMTLPAHRQRGLGRALLTAVLAATSAVPLVFLVADEDDWPLALYQRLGFEVVGRVYVLNGSIAHTAPVEP